MKASSIILGIFLVARFSLEASAESLRLPESSVHATGIPMPTTGIPLATLKLTEAKSRADGSIEFKVDSTEQFKVLIESSADLTNWTFEALREPRAALVFTNNSKPAIHRFYRAADYTLRVEGWVWDIETDLPVGQAKVTVSDLFWETQDIVTQTDARGMFRAAVSREYPFQKIIVEKAGYEVLTTEPRIDLTNPYFQIALLLAPPGSRPPNDDFQNRLAIQGTNVSVRARTFAASSEPGHRLDIFFDDYVQSYPRNLWWTWTAPSDGAVLIQRDEIQPESGVVVYTGQSLPDLVSVWDTSNPENAFFVKQGVQYQICFGTVSPAETGFTLRMVAPVPPFAVHARIGDLLLSGSPIRTVGEAIYLSVTANGTSPLSYQWRKDGLDIPDTTNAFFFKSDIGLADAGKYSVLVANDAGTVISHELPITVLLNQLWRDRASALHDQVGSSVPQIEAQFKRSPR
jgi:hypothetical protein